MRVTNPYVKSLYERDDKVVWMSEIKKRMEYLEMEDIKGPNPHTRDSDGFDNLSESEIIEYTNLDAITTDDNKVIHKKYLKEYLEKIGRTNDFYVFVEDTDYLYQVIKKGPPESGSRDV